MIKKFYIFRTLFALALTGCAFLTSVRNTQIAILSPTPFDEIRVGDKVAIKLSVKGKDVNRVIVLINNTAHKDIAMPSAPAGPLGHSFTVVWEPPQAAEYQIQAVAYQDNTVISASPPLTISVNPALISQARPTPTPTFNPFVTPQVLTPALSDSPTPTEATTISVPTPTPTPEPQPTAAIRVVNQSLNIRSLPTVNSDRIGVLQKGEERIIIGVSPDRQWYRLSDGGWVFAQYVEVIGEAGALPLISP